MLHSQQKAPHLYLIYPNKCFYVNNCICFVFKCGNSCLYSYACWPTNYYGVPTEQFCFIVNHPFSLWLKRINTVNAGGYQSIVT